jgi:glycosyltransferase involved in cell wall biosynthesis
VVATQVGGNPELVKHEVTGLLTPSENPTKLAESINRILDDDVLSKQICENSYNFVINNMTWESILPKYIEFYENLLKN